MNICVINGPNINMLGSREPDVYGKTTYKELIKKIEKHAKNDKINVKCFVSNYEGKIVTYIQKHLHVDALIINMGAFSHYSYAIYDALKMYKGVIVEVHMSNVEIREEFRNNLIFTPLVKKQIIGQGINGYIQAIDYIKEVLK